MVGIFHACHYSSKSWSHFRNIYKVIIFTYIFQIYTYSVLKETFQSDLAIQSFDIISTYFNSLLYTIINLYLISVCLIVNRKIEFLGLNINCFLRFSLHPSLVISYIHKFLINIHNCGSQRWKYCPHFIPRQKRIY